MLREQRYSLFSECYIGGGVEDEEFFGESAGDVIKNIIEKIKEGCANIIKKITEFFSKKKDKKEINPDVEVDEKKVSNIGKILKKLRQALDWPLKKYLEMVNKHFFVTWLGTTLTAIAAWDLYGYNKWKKKRANTIELLQTTMDKRIVKNKKIYASLENLAKEGKITSEQLSKYADQCKNVNDQLEAGKGMIPAKMEEKFGPVKYRSTALIALKEMMRLLTMVISKIVSTMNALIKK